MSVTYIRISPQEIKIPCTFCKTVYTIPVTAEQIREFEEGEDIQNILPDMKIALREMLISGICGRCWNEAHGVDPNYDPDEEEEEDDSEDWPPVVCRVCGSDAVMYTSDECGHFCTDDMKKHIKTCQRCHRSFAAHMPQ